MDKKSLKNIIKKLKLDEQAIIRDIQLLPQTYQEEFIEDVLVDDASLISFSKVFSYYLTDIWEELSDMEKKCFEEKFFIISL